MERTKNEIDADLVTEAVRGHGLRSMRAAVALACLLVACTGGSRQAEPGRGEDRPTQRVVYVAIGASDSVGIGADRPAEQAWPEVLRRAHLPPDTAFTNLAAPGATVSGALAYQLPRALPLAPTLVTVWLNANDILAGVPPGTYEAQLRQLVAALRRGGATKVLVANTPPLERLPAYLACRRQGPRPPCRAALVVPPEVVRAVVAAYNAAIERVVSSEGAVLVDLHRESQAREAEGRWAQLISSDGFHPSTEGHRQVAEAFARAF